MALKKEQLPKLSEDSLKFLKTAHKQKTREWLDKNKDRYELVLKKPFVQLATEIKKELTPIARGYHFPSKGLGRIRRPEFKVKAGEAIYKDWISLIASKPSASRFESNPHLFFGLFPNEKDQILVAAGLWQPTSRQTRLIRELIDTEPEAFQKLFKSKKFKERFPKGFFMEDQGVKVPRGFAPDHPFAEWLKLKKFVVLKSYTPQQLQKKNFNLEVIKDLKVGLELNQLLDKALNISKTAPLNC